MTDPVDHLKPANPDSVAEALSHPMHSVSEAGGVCISGHVYVVGDGWVLG